MMVPPPGGEQGGVPELNLELPTHDLDATGPCGDDMEPALTESERPTARSTVLRTIKTTMSATRPMIAYTATRVVAQGVEFVGWALIAHRLATAGFGALAIGFIACRYLWIIADWGAMVRGPRDIASGSHAIPGLLATRRRASALLALGYFLGCLALGHMALALLGGTIIARGIARDWIAVGRERGVRAGLPSLLQGLGVFVTGMTHTTLTGYAISISLTYLAASALSLYLNPPATRPGGIRSSVGAPWLVILGLSDQLSSSADVFLLALLHSAASAGVYAAVYRIPNAWIGVTGMLAAASVPRSARQVQTYGVTRVLIRRRLLLGSAAAFFLLLISPLLVRSVGFLFGHAYVAGEIPLLILIAATAAITASVPLQPLLLVQGRDRYLAVVTIAGTTVNLLANFALIPTLGATGAALATLTSQSVVSALVIASFRSQRRLRHQSQPST